MTVTGKMIHYLLLLGSLERSGMNRREEANTPATLTATERGASTWHLFLFIGLSVAPPTTSLSQPNLLFVLQVAGPSGSPFRGILDIYRTSRLPLRGIVFSFNFRQMLTGFSRLITAS